MTPSRVFYIVCAVLGVAFLLTLVFCGLFVLADKEIPDLFGQLALAELTGLTGLLVPRPNGEKDV